MRKVKEYLGLVMVILGTLIVVVPAFYWHHNDHLTQMQIQKQFWFIYPIIILFYGIGYYLLKDDY